MKRQTKWLAAGGAMILLAVVTLKIWADNSAATNAAPVIVDVAPATAVAPVAAPVATPAAPATSPAAAFLEDPLKEWVAQLTKALPPLKGLDLNPQIISGTDGKGSSFGLGYKYDRELVAFPNSLAGDLSLNIHSEGIYLADPKSIPNNVFKHTVSLSWIDILPPSFETTNRMAGTAKARLNQRLAKAEDLWDESKNQSEKDALLYTMQQELPGTGKLVAKTNGLYVNTPDGKQPDLETYLETVTPRALFLSADVDGSIEHDQNLKNVQYLGEAQLRTKLLFPLFDYPALLLRKIIQSNKDGNGAILDWKNLAGGPYLWGGAGLVDATQNEARKAITTDHEVFPRLNVGCYYRTELFGFSPTQSIALELNWLFNYELDAPAAIRARQLDLASYFKATLLLPVIKSGNAFVEYSAGQLPVDLIDGQTVSVGWRYSF